MLNLDFEKFIQVNNPTQTLSPLTLLRLVFFYPLRTGGGGGGGGRNNPQEHRKLIHLAK